MYAVGILVKEGGSNIDLRIDLTGDGCIGMLPVFSTKDAAEKAYPHYPIFELEHGKQSTESEE